MSRLIPFGLIVLISFNSCSQVKKLQTPSTQADESGSTSFGYQPLDPLPVFFAKDSGGIPVILLNDVSLSFDNKQIMHSLPDETMRLAIGQVDNQGNISFGPAKIGYANSDYEVILDYMKFDTKAYQINIKKDSLNHITDFAPIIYKTDTYTKPDASVPVYVGVGLRLTATVHVNEGHVDLGNLFALGIAAESKKINGTLIIQTLGITGESISPLIPMPNQINTTTIQNAIMALASIKAKMYEADAQIRPRILGFYNNLGGGQSTVYKFISDVQQVGITHLVK